MGNRTITATISELARLVYEMPEGGEINFTCREDDDFWAVKKINIFDGPVVIIGSYGGGETVAKDIQIDCEEDEIANFLDDALLDHSIGEVYIDPSKSTLVCNEIEPYANAISTLKLRISKDIRELMLSRELKTINLEGYEIYVAWFDGDNVGYDSMVVNVCLNRNNYMELEVQGEDGIVHLDCNEFACYHLEWLNNIYEAIVSEFKFQDEEM